MTMPACYVVSAAEWSQFLDALLWMWLAPPVLWILIRTDFWRIADRWRVHRRRRRLRRTRSRRSEAGPVSTALRTAPVAGKAPREPRA